MDLNAGVDRWAAAPAVAVANGVPPRTPCRGYDAEAVQATRHVALAVAVVPRP